VFSNPVQARFWIGLNTSWEFVESGIESRIFNITFMGTKDVSAIIFFHSAGVRSRKSSEGRSKIENHLVLEI
jgi:hypothetical protein